jgi:hypothetical protein
LGYVRVAIRDNGILLLTFYSSISELAESGANNLLIKQKQKATKYVSIYLSVFFAGPILLGMCTMVCMEYGYDKCTPFSGSPLMGHVCSDLFENIDKLKVDNCQTPLWLVCEERQYSYDNLYHCQASLRPDRDAFVSELNHLCSSNRGNAFYTDSHYTTWTFGIAGQKIVKA